MLLPCVYRWMCLRFCFYICMHVCIDVCAPNSVCRCVCSKLQQLNTLLLAYHLFDYSSLIVEAWLRRDWAWRSWKRITSKPTRRRLCPNWWSSWTRCRWYLSSDCIYRSDGIYRSGGIWYRSMVSIYRAWNHGIVVMPCMHASERDNCDEHSVCDRLKHSISHLCRQMWLTCTTHELMLCVLRHSIDWHSSIFKSISNQRDWHYWHRLRQVNIRQLLWFLESL